MRDELTVLSAFLTVAEERSFTRAAKRLNISTSGLSQAIRKLEERIGVRLLTRTTRSVSPTDAGEQLLAHLRPALGDIRTTLTNLSGLQSRPVGRLRSWGDSPGSIRMWNSTSRPTTVGSISWPAGFDAGIQFGEFIAQGMVAVGVTVEDPAQHS
jgi:DNA-binding MarR family transcriptional regulator